MATPAEQVAEILDQAGAISVDLPCGSCQYNLRGLQAKGNCPECGKAIKNSIDAWWEARNIGFPEPEHAHVLARGLDRGLAAYALAIALVLGGPLLEPWSYSAGLRNLVELSALALAVLAWILAFWGCWLFTAPPPVGLSPLRHSFSRTFLRWAGLLFLGTIAPLVAITWFTSPNPDGATTLLAIVMLISGIASWLSLKTYAAILAYRLGCDILATFIGTSAILDILLPCFALGTLGGLGGLTVVVVFFLLSFTLLVTLREYLMRRADPRRQTRWTRWLW